MATRKPTATSGGTGASHSATVSRRQVMRRRNRLRSRSMNKGAKSRCPAVVCRSSRPSAAALSRRELAPPAIPASPTASPGPAAGSGGFPEPPTRPCDEKSLAALLGPAEFDLRTPTARRCDIPNCRAAGPITASASNKNRSSRASTICRCSLTPRSARSPVPDSRRLRRYTSNSIPSSIPAGVAGPAGRLRIATPRTRQPARKQPTRFRTSARQKAPQPARRRDSSCDA